jgi:hypothetical protein
VDEGVRDLCEALEEVLDGNGPGGTDATPAALCRAALRSSTSIGPATTTARCWPCAPT